MNMNFSVGMKYVAAHAKIEADAIGQNEISPEHMFLGILEFSELSNDDVEPFDDSKKTGNSIKNINKVLDGLDMDKKSAKRLLRRKIRADSLTI